MKLYEVRQLHEWYLPERFSVHSCDGLMLSRHESDAEAYSFMHSLVQSKTHDKLSPILPS